MNAPGSETGPGLQLVTWGKSTILSVDAHGFKFEYTLNSAKHAAGSGEAREGGPSYEGRIIRRGDQSPEAMREKACFVLGAMELRMAALGFGWADVTATQGLYDLRHPSAPG